MNIVDLKNFFSRPDRRVEDELKRLEILKDLPREKISELMSLFPPLIFSSDLSINFCLHLRDEQRYPLRLTINQGIDFVLDIIYLEYSIYVLRDKNNKMLLPRGAYESIYEKQEDAIYNLEYPDEYFKKKEELQKIERICKQVSVYKPDEMINLIKSIVDGTYILLEE